MSILLLNEQEVRRLLTMDMALEAVELAFRKMALEEVQNIPRARSQTDHATLHVMSAAAKTLGVMGYKAYGTSKQGANFHVGLFDGKTSELSAIIQADYLGQVRTGAASGVATKYMARKDASEVGIFGSGKQARTQLEAVCKVRDIKRIRVYSRNVENRTTFTDELTTVCGCPVEPVDQPELAAKDTDIIITATNSKSPVLKGEWIRDGTHLNVIGSNFWTKSEVDVACVMRCDPIVVDQKDQARIEAGDLAPALAGELEWMDVTELRHVVVGRTPGRNEDGDVTMFKSLGIALEDIAVAKVVIERAKEEGVGRWIEW